MNPDALLIGFDDSISLTIHLDYKDNEKLYIKLGNTTVIDRREYEKLLGFLRLTKPKVKSARAGKAALLSPKSLAAEGHVWMFENGTLKITYGKFVKTISQEAFYILLTELENGKNNLIRYDKIKDLSPDARAAMGIDEVGRPSTVKDAVYKARVIGYSLVVVIFLINTFLGIAAVFNLFLIPLVAAIYLFLVDVYLLLPASEKKAIAMFRANAKDYINEDMFKNLDSLPVSRKGIEFFLIIGMAMVFFTAYFSKAIPEIMKWGKDLYGETSENSQGFDDIMKTASMFKQSGVDDFDIKKKLYNCSGFISRLFKTATMFHITFDNTNFTWTMGGGFLDMKADGSIITSNPANFTGFKRELCRHKPFEYCDGDRVENRFSLDIRARFNMTYQPFWRAMRHIKSNSSKVRKKISRAMQIFTGKEVKLNFGVSSVKKGKQVHKIGVEGYAMNGEEIAGFVKSIETEPEVLQILPDYIGYANGKIQFKLTVTACYK